jgi:hypothetical protein
MKLPTLAIILGVVVGLTNASYLPGFVIQNDDSIDYITIDDSTKLIKNCGDANDLLRQVSLLYGNKT